MSAYEKYYVYKQLVSYDSGTTWEETGIETYSGTPIGEYDTLQECEGLPIEGEEYLTYQLLDAGAYTPSLKPSNLIQYSFDGGYTWSTGDGSNILSGISFGVGDKVCFKGELYPPTGSGEVFRSVLGPVIEGGFWKIYGHVSSLVYGDDKKSYNKFRGQGLLFNGTFGEQWLSPSVNRGGVLNKYGIVDASELKLVSGQTTTPTANMGYVQGIYDGMFKNCETLVSAPELPQCSSPWWGAYREMFMGCKSLVNPPSVLPTSNIDSYTYESMFEGCTSLRRVPRFPSKFKLLDHNTSSWQTYAEGMKRMFAGCTSLQSFPYALRFETNTTGGTHFTDPAYTSLNEMFSGCTSLTGSVTIAYDYFYGGCIGCSTFNRVIEGTNVSNLNISLKVFDPMIFGGGTYNGLCKIFANTVVTSPLTGTITVSCPSQYAEEMREDDRSGGCGIVPAGWTKVIVSNDE